MAKELDIFEQINNAVLDLQASQLQTYVRPLKTLSHLLGDVSLKVYNDELKAGVDVDAFLAEGEKSGGSMVGSQELFWPDDTKQVMGLTLLIIDKLAAEPSFAVNFSHYYFYSGSKVVAGIHSMTRQLIIPFVRDYKTYVLSSGETKLQVIKERSNKIFIVHGHDGEARESLARFISHIGFEPIILHEQANQGRTIIEKVEAHSDVGFAVVLLTPDDEGREKGASDFQPRARQNVLLELGYFIGKLGRKNICALKRGDIDLPSDFAGVVWETMDPGNGWKASLARELKAAEYVVDWNKVMN